MLYDVLPPLFFFVSLGGIILVVSRVILRVQRKNFSEEMQAEHISRVPARGGEHIVAPGKKGLQLAKNRMALMSQAAQSGVLGLKSTMMSGVERVKHMGRRKDGDTDQGAQESARQEDQTSTEQGIQIPQGGFRERMMTFVTRGKERAGEMGQAISTKVSERAQRIQEKRDARKQGKEESIEQQYGTSSQESEGAESGSRIKLVRRTQEPRDQRGVISQVLKRDTRTPMTPMEEASVAIQASQFEKAEDILVPYIVKHANDAKAYMLLGKSALGQGSWEEAIEIFSQVKKINAKEPGVYGSLGYAAFRAGKFSMAVEALQQARKEEPGNVQVLEQLLAIAKRMDNKVLEKSVQEELAELEPQKVRVR